MIYGLVGSKQYDAANLRRFGNLIARCRRDALRIMGDGRGNMRYRLGFVGERLMAAFDDIDAGTTFEQRLMLIGANPADARDVEAGHDSMLHLVCAHCLEWSAMRRRDGFINFDRAPLYWSVGFVMFDWMKTDEAQRSVDAAFHATFGGTFKELATGRRP